MTDRDLHTRTEGEGETLDMPEGLGAFSKGQVLGERYQILEMLGRGGMGEVWQAFDLKLRVEVALKALRPEFFKSERRLEMLRDEVRAAREVVSPNVCRIFDLIEIEGRELVSMEYVDGATLLGVLQERGPLDLKEAQDIASQFLAGLEAIHKVGLVHRDIKPENIMLTRAGRVVVMDFGLARQDTEGGGSVSGTPAYMAPEQATGQQLDARADVYAAGVVLAEMVSPDGIKSYESRQSVWEGVRSEPAQVPDSPWAPVISRAVARDRERRQNSAHTLIRELEDVTLRVEGAEDLHPYPGLASFTEDDAEYFFGREAEVEQMWRRLEGPARMLAIMGPSGAGKSSFIAAGLVANVPPSWGIIRSTPGNAAIPSLAGVVAREMAGDPDAVELLPRFDDADVAVQVFAHWSRKNAHSLLVIDQFEELFTQNTPEEQRLVADLLSRLVLEADVHVLLSMRDDFAAGCHAHESLQPIFHDLTVLDSPTGGNLRRAMVQPAKKCGYRFEDNELVAEMLAEVEGERGALPLLAFALARLWDQRDRETGLLTRQAYQDIGGVGGALARHAEATIERIGAERLPIVREFFRNLVTAEGTRAVREWDELLSIFSDSRGEPPEEVLRELIDARLLTSYEIHEEDEAPTRRVEIIHESLLANWPRLVRWQTQDADAAQFRDQLRHAARTWDDQGRSDDTLWTGAAYREFASWRERYAGGLTEVEEAFAAAMTSLANRRRKRRRNALAAGFAVLLGVLAVIGALWQHSRSEALRAEAANLVSIAQLHLEDHPTGSVAYATRSLELADSPQARHIAVEALWLGPTEFRVTPGSPFSVDFSPDGKWMLAAERRVGGRLWPSDGSPPTLLDARRTSGEGRISPRGDLIASYDIDMQELLVWSFPEGRFLRSFPVGGTYSQLFWFSGDGSRLITSTEIQEGNRLEVLIRSWPVDGGEPKLLARLESSKDSMGTFFGVDPTATTVAWVDGSTFNMAPLEGAGPDPQPVVTARHDDLLSMAVFDDSGRMLATSDLGGTLKVWSLGQEQPTLLRTVVDVGVQFPWSLRFDPSGSMLGSASGILVDLDAPPEAEPLILRRAPGAVLAEQGEMGVGVAFHPKGTWIATGRAYSISLWPLGHPYPRVLHGHREGVSGIAFTPDSAQVVSVSGDNTARVWSVANDSARESRTIYTGKGTWDTPLGPAVAPDGSFVSFGTFNGSVWVIPLDVRSAPEQMYLADVVTDVAVDAESRLVAGGGGAIDRAQAVVRVKDLETGEVRILDAGDGASIGYIDFTSDNDLLVDSGMHVRRWNLSGPEPRVVDVVDLGGPEHIPFVYQGHMAGGDEILFVREGRLLIYDFRDGSLRELSSHGQYVFRAALDPAGEIVVSSDRKGVLRAGPVTDAEPHLMFGHRGSVEGVAISPDGQWVASCGEDETVRLWPMPDLSKPPLHTLPREELIAKLKTMTNLRAIRDDVSSAGWKLVVGPFPGWETVPTW